MIIETLKAEDKPESAGGEQWAEIFEFSCLDFYLKVY